MTFTLRARLLLVTAILLALTLGAAGVLFSRLATIRFEQILAQDDAAKPLAMSGRLAAEIARRPSEARAALERVARETGRLAMWIRTDGVVEIAPRDAFHGRASSDGMAVRIEQRVPSGELSLVELHGGAAIVDSSGRALGRALMGPSVNESRGVLPGGTRRAVRIPVERQAISGLNRSLAIAAAACGLVGIALAFALSRRILGPVESLTRAARRMESGDLGARVPAQGGRDEIGALAAAFNAMADRIERTERLRRDLVSDVAHELRTPLTHLRCRLEAIQDGLAPIAEDTVNALHDDVLTLQRLVEDLQDLSVAEAGRLRLELAEVPPRDALDRAAAAAGPAAQRAGIAMIVRIDGDVPAARADARRLAQVLGNLLANAIAHTPEGGEIELAARARDGMVEFAVTDTGAGIEPEHLSHVFERFWRADPSRDRATGGAGLGLAIVQQVVRAMGGEVRVASARGAGSTFSFTLPRT